MRMHTHTHTYDKTEAYMKVREAAESCDYEGEFISDVAGTLSCKSARMRVDVRACTCKSVLVACTHTRRRLP